MLTVSTWKFEVSPIKYVEFVPSMLLSVSDNQEIIRAKVNSRITKKTSMNDLKINFYSF